MEINVLENEKNRLKFEIKGESHSFCNALRRELWNENNIEIAGYHIEHSMISEPVFVVQTSKGDPKKVVFNAVESLHKKNKSLKEAFKKI